MRSRRCDRSVPCEVITRTENIRRNIWPDVSYGERNMSRWVINNLDEGLENARKRRWSVFLMHGA